MSVQTGSNHLYSVLKQPLNDFPTDDFSLAVAPSIDSFVVGVQAKTTLAYTSELDITLYPLGGVAAYLYLNTMSMSTRQPSSDAVTTGIRVDYLDLNGVVHPLFVFDNRQFSLPNTTINRLIPLPIVQMNPGTVYQPNSIGNLQFTVTSTSAVGAHAVTYDIFLCGSFVYLIPDQSTIDELVEYHVAKHKGDFLQDLEEMLKRVTVPVLTAAEVSAG